MKAALKCFPLDTVILWVTPTVERDYIARNAFPALRNAAAVELRSGGARHMLTLAEAADVHADADAQYKKTRHGVKLAYGRLERGLVQEIQSAQERVAQAALERATQLWGHTHGEAWRGSRRQLAASGFVMEEALPGEGEAVSRRARARDHRGFAAMVSATPWEGVFVATVTFPKEHIEKLCQAEKAEEDRRKEAYREALILQHAPATPAAFLEGARTRFWNHVNRTVGELRGCYGYRLDESSVQDFLDSAAEAFHAIADGSVTGKSLHEHIAANRLEAARKDAGLQRFLTACRSETE